jgi:hypothetical protein
LGVSLAAKYYLQIYFFKGVTKDQKTNICSELSVRSGSTVALVYVTPDISTLLDTAIADQDVLWWSKDGTVIGDSPRTFGQMNKLGRAEIALQALLRCLDYSGNFDSKQTLCTPPPTNPKLLYSDLNLGNAGQFCDAAAATVIWNIYKACSSPTEYFSTYRIGETARAVLDISKKGKHSILL